MIRKLLIILCLCSPTWATTTITGNLKNLSGGSISLGTFVRFYLRGCSGNQPRINGTALIAPTLGNVYYTDFVPSSLGVISGTVYSTTDATGTGNGDIECGGLKTGLWYGMVPFLNGKAGPETPVAAKNTATIDISNVTPITTNPVVVAPTGDTTYARLDAGNQPFTGLIQAPSATIGKFDNLVVIDGVKYACTAAGINSGISDVNGNVSGATTLVDARGCGGINFGTTTVTIGPAAGITLWLGSGTFTCNSTAAAVCINMNSEGGGLLGNGPFSTRIRINNAVGDGIQVNQQFTYMKDFTIDSLVTRTGTPEAKTVGGGIHVLGGLGTYYNIRIERTGVGILLDQSAAGFTGNNAFNDIRMGSGGFATGNWIDYVYVGATDSASGTVADSHFNHLIVTLDLAPSIAVIDLDGGADSFECTSCSIGKNGTVSANLIFLHNGNGNNTAPTFPHFNNFLGEAGTTGNCVEAVAVQDFESFDGYCASSNIGIHLNGTSSSIKGFQWNGGIIENIQHQGVLLEANQTNSGFQLIGVKVSDTSQAANGGSNAITIGAGSTNLQIVGNDCSSIKGFVNQPFHCISVVAGSTNHYTIANNNLAAFGIDEGGTGTDKNVYGNLNPFTPATDTFQVGQVGFGERVNPSGQATEDVCYGDSTLHGRMCSDNNTTYTPMGSRAILTADWTCGTGGTVASCVAATIIGSGGGVAWTFALPLVANSLQLDCDGVVGQATGVTLNQWNLLTATNGATNVTASYVMATAATAMAVGAVTDQGSTTTTFQIAPSWTLGGTGTKMPFHIHAAIEGAAAAGTVLSVQLLAPTVGDLVTIFRGSGCWIHP